MGRVVNLNGDIEADRKKEYERQLAIQQSPQHQTQQMVKNSLRQTAGKTKGVFSKVNNTGSPIMKQAYQDFGKYDPEWGQDSQWILRAGEGIQGSLHSLAATPGAIAGGTKQATIDFWDNTFHNQPLQKANQQVRLAKMEQANGGLPLSGKEVRLPRRGDSAVVLSQLGDREVKEAEERRDALVISRPAQNSKS